MDRLVTLFKRKDPPKKDEDKSPTPKPDNDGGGAEQKSKTRESSSYSDMPKTRGFSEYGKAQVNDVRAIMYQKPDVEVEPAVRFLVEKGYTIVDRVGIGNYAHVYRVRLQNKKDMAVKIIDLENVSKNYKVRFLPRELKIMRRLHHKNIVKVYGIQSTQKFCFIFMEYLPNGTLGDFIRRNGPLSEMIARALFAQLIEAIHYMHAQGVAHRDLKLENILLDKFQNPKVADFSYSLVVIRDPMSGVPAASNTFCGSLPYMSPEILQKLPYDPKAADVWSLGICLYIVLNDRVPFKFTDIPGMLRNQIGRSWAFKPRIQDAVSEDLKDLVAKMLEPDFKTRITTMGIMLHPWFTKQSGPSPPQTLASPLLSQPPTMPPPPGGSSGG